MARLLPRRDPRLPRDVERSIEASLTPDATFERLELLVRRYPELAPPLLRAANAPARRGLFRVTRVREALVRLGVRGAGRVLIDAVLREQLSNAA